MRKTRTSIKLLLVLGLTLQLTGCDNPKVYGSIGVSSYHGSSSYYGGSRVGGSIMIGGRIR
jgi:hypothetical protein